MREQAERSGALHMLAGAEVLGIDTAPGGPVPRGRAVRTSQGDIETPVCGICCGVWSPRIAAMAGARIPLTPIVRQMISVGPGPRFAAAPGECPSPTWRAVAETAEVGGVWVVAASWIKEGPGIGRAMAEWMSGQEPEIDIHEADIARFYPCQRTVAHVQARAREGFNKMYGIVHPAEQWESGRPVRVSPVYQRERELGAVFCEAAGWERPNWYASNENLLERYPRRLMEREAEWESRWWSPIINAEHLAMRDACGLIDLSAFAVLDITGPGALAVVQTAAVAQLDVRVGRVAYT